MTLTLESVAEALNNRRVNNLVQEVNLCVSPTVFWIFWMVGTCLSAWKPLVVAQRLVMCTTLSIGGLLQCVRSSPESHCVVATISDASLAHVGYRVGEHLKVTLAIVPATRDVEIQLAEANHLLAVLVSSDACRQPRSSFHWSSGVSGSPRC